jgi:hypothetical protein
VYLVSHDDHVDATEEVREVEEPKDDVQQADEPAPQPRAQPVDEGVAAGNLEEMEDAYELKQLEGLHIEALAVEDDGERARRDRVNKEPSRRHVPPPDELGLFDGDALTRGEGEVR